MSGVAVTFRDFLNQGGSVFLLADRKPKAGLGKPHCRGDRGAVVGGRYGTVGRGSMSWQHSVTWAAGSTSNRLSGPGRGCAML